ncbi:MAG: D-tyrosyl-tRNA(Tyr) deacylase [Deltaproteobacteria bacterium]|nr:D-tyrosyl-tRNA(Tyr) deacylase [Deltaproteobacteria bacterium]
MKAVVQRVSSASVLVRDRMIASIGKGLLVFLGIEKRDANRSAIFLAEKISNLRIFEDSSGKMNLSLIDIGGDLMVVSQFTLLADCKKGNRPAFTNAEHPERAKIVYEFFIEQAKKRIAIVQQGVFQETMKVNIVNDGPVTIVLDDRRSDETEIG